MSQLDGTWYQALFQQLSENLRRKDAEKIFANASFIIFNYDRCVEHVFSRLIEAYYDVPAQDAQYIMDLVPITHPYGTVGYLPWQTENFNEAVEFGANQSTDLVKSMERIRTFTEGQDNLGVMQNLHAAIADAHTIVFLGFSYGRQNLTLMTPHSETSVRHLYGTALGLFPEEREVVDGEVRGMVRGGWNGVVGPLQMHGETCNQLLNRIGRVITV